MLASRHCLPLLFVAGRSRSDARAQRAAGEKPRYDGTWRPEPGKTLPPVPEGRKPVVRFKNPLDGDVTWNDVVKGPITISNRELDDLVIARPDGTPTYNFCVAVDDWDMRITHVIRGDDHVNNTPRQINILRALGAPLPDYGHVPMILGADGEKLSKRHGAVSVMEYPAQGYLPEAMLNYLARLGWSHGDDEIFSMEQFCRWFDLDHLSKSPAQFNPEKLAWLNNHYIKQADNARLDSAGASAAGARRRAVRRRADLPAVIALMKERANTINELADAAMLFYRQPEPDAALARAACDRCGEAGAGAVCRALRDGRMEQGGIVGGDEGSAGRAQAEDAATGDAVAPDGHRPVADAGDRCGAGIVRSRSGARRALRKFSG